MHFVRSTLKHNSVGKYSNVTVQLLLTICLPAMTISSIYARDIPALVNKAKPSVVTIIAYDSKGDTLAQGSGFFVNSKGHVVTNYHVLYGAHSAEVRSAAGVSYQIQDIIISSYESDIVMANLSDPPDHTPYLPITRNIPVQGEEILVFGSPYGFELTVSEGIVSAIRQIPDFGKIIQITAPISSGSSGGPVVNMRGEVFGIATFQYLEGQNLNFAVPVDMILSIKPEKEIPIGEWTTQLERDLYESTEWLLYLGSVYVWAAEYDSAIYYFNAVAEKDPSNSEAYFWLGYCYDEFGDYQAAISVYKKSIEINPDFATAYYNLGVVYYNLEQYEEAQRYCQMACKIDPTLVESYYTLGLTYYSMEQLNAAKEMYQKAIEVDPSYVESYVGIGHVYYDLEEYQKAIDAYKTVIDLDPTYSQAYLWVSMAYGDLGKYNIAVMYCQKAIQSNSEYAEAHFIMGSLKYILGDTNSAIQEMNTLRDLNPSLANQLSELMFDDNSQSELDTSGYSRYGFQPVLVLEDLGDDEHIIILLADGAKIYLEAKTFCFTFGLLDGLIVDAEVDTDDVKIFYDGETYEYWIQQVQKQ